MSASIARLVAFSCDHARLVAAAGVLLGVFAFTYAMQHFAMNTDTDRLLSAHLAYRERQAAFSELFQSEGDQMVVVVDGATPELADAAAGALAARLQSRPDLLRMVRRPDGGPFFDRNGLLFDSTSEVKLALAQMIAAQPFLGPLAADPSLRGLMAILSTALQGVTAGETTLGALDRPIAALADSLERVGAGRAAAFSWRTMVSGKPAPPRSLRRLILASPIVDFAQLQSGARATHFIRLCTQRLRLDPAHGVRVRLTGPTPLQDEEFGTLAQRAGLIATLALSAIIVMLWLAVRSARLIGAILASTLIGLVSTAACGLIVFHTFNVISVAFIPLFVGLGIDFGIQFTVRFRAEYAADMTARDALIASGRGMGRSLTLAASAIACGFLAFAPTAYVGVSQLGMIAGIGMFIALALSLCVLPAFIALAPPPRPPPRFGAGALQRLDAFILGHRRQVLGAACLAAVLCAGLLPWLRFDFNPIHLRSAATESVSTLLDLMADADQSPNTLEVVAPSLAAADRIAARLRVLPQVAEVITLSSFVPSDQAQKLAAIGDASVLLDLTLDPLTVQTPPTDAEVVSSLWQTAADLRRAAIAAAPGPANDARRLARVLETLAAAKPAARAQAAAMLSAPLATALQEMRNSLQAAPVSLQTLPANLTRDWLAADGRARVSIVPRGDSNDNGVLTRFITAVLAVAPNATGTPIGIREGAHTVAGAFIEAGVLSFLAITALLFLVLRRLRDVVITMAPILLTGLLTLGSCVIIGQPLNFANIIALPLLFGIGVAFHIYFVMAWRSGGAHLLQSSLTRAIFFSALATATGFGSLWASSHPGTASMGKLLMISLIWTLVSALLFQPALMGPPPADAKEPDGP